MEEKKSEEIFLKVQDLANRWKISESPIYNGISNGTFPVKPVKIGRRVRFRLKDVEKYEETL